MSFRAAASCSLFLMVLVAVTTASCGGGPTAPSGTNLSGTWRTNQLQIKASGETATFTIQWTVDPNSSTVSQVYMVNSRDNKAISGTAAAIKNADFEFSADIPNSGCSQETGRFRLSGRFNSGAQAQGDWSVSNVAPAGYCFSGSESGSWTASK